MWKHIELLRKLGEGGMGEVWLVYHSDLGAQFAVKKLKPELMREKDFKRFQREIKYLQQLRHPNIVRIVDVSDDPAKPGYAMELCPEGSLDSNADVIRTDTDRCLRVFWEVASGLEYLHSQQPAIIHRDVKPANVLIGADGKAKVSDFGLSRSVATERVTSSVWVTPGFSPPEQYDNFAETDERGDLFALGATLYFLLTGNTYSLSLGLMGIDREDTRFILDRLLQREPTRRFGSVGDLTACWDVLQQRNKSITEYLQLDHEQRLAKIGVVSDLYCGMPNDLDLCTDAVELLEKIVKVEADVGLLAAAQRGLEHVKSQLKQIGMEMERDKASY